ncbi:NUDIX domain-containing protein [Geodermatophilus sp. YIM 151500]|uniref:NUDIX domain-containing protein n=1 Tax=Geodermatophilus sp. YIM 151500 TaxID=2984531 RepID=UPI0021E4E4B3|nr:NUDIX domain-containing protein [Geodermatophilus sp. YIM 151500]MCV2490638.1 NUDIX domain-containing protein [Geodermatophilus sp. YIM 151500]
MRSPTDSWTTCALGHRHWGLAGAAGLLLHRDAADGPELLLQHRAPWSHHGGTWGTPGGALHVGEPPEAGALREVREELGLTAADVVLGARSIDDHGGWAYTTVLARPARRIEAGDLTLDGESAGAAWLPLAALTDVELHPGLAASLDRLRPLLLARDTTGGGAFVAERTDRSDPAHVAEALDVTDATG